MDTGKSRPSIRDLMRPDLRHLAGYTPVVPVERLIAEASASSRVTLTPIKLDANENPYGPSPRVLQAISESEALHTYPDAEQRTLRAALAEYAGLATENIIVGNGSDEVLDMIIRLLLEPGDRVLSCIPTFGMYKFLTDVAGGQLIELQRTPDYGIDLDAIKAATDERTKLIFLASPNNPTGNSVPREKVIALLEMGLYVVIDEAYFEFAGHTVADLVNDYENLMVVRTFSKWAGLAGVRIGYAIVSRKSVHLPQPDQAALQHQRICPDRRLGVAARPGLPDAQRPGPCEGKSPALRFSPGSRLSLTHPLRGQLHPLQRHPRQR